MKDNRIRAVVCDYPSLYKFPGQGYGSIERWLATVARHLSLEGHEVIVSGPLWDCRFLPPEIRWWPDRLCASNTNQFLAKWGKMDLLVAGHEAFGKSELYNGYLAVARRCVSYQHGHELYGVRAYDGKRKRLFCFSDEMMERFHDQKPRKLPCYAEGIHEKPRRRPPEPYLVWLGRLDEEKAVHYAIEAAGKLRRKLVIMGDSVRSVQYKIHIQALLSQSHVEWVGTTVGEEKMERLARSCCMVYTCSPTWIEAAASVLWEGQLSGVPLSGMSWRGSEALVEAVGDRKDVIASTRTENKHEQNVDLLCEAIERAIMSNRDDIYQYAHSKLNARKHISGLLDE